MSLVGLSCLDDTFWFGYALKVEIEHCYGSYLVG